MRTHEYETEDTPEVDELSELEQAMPDLSSYIAMCEVREFEDAQHLTLIGMQFNSFQVHL